MSQRLVPSAAPVQDLEARDLCSAKAQPMFPRLPGETPRAFSAFQVFFQLGHGRSLPALAEQLGEKPDTLKSWSSRFRWNERIHAFTAGLLDQQAEAHAAACRQQAADWARRTQEFREQEWDASQKLVGAVQCFLEGYGDPEVEKMTLAQVSRALATGSRIARLALNGASLPEEPGLAPIQQELAAALKRAYAQASTPVAGNPPAGGETSTKAA